METEPSAAAGHDQASSHHSAANAKRSLDPAERATSQLASGTFVVEQSYWLPSGRGARCTQNDTPDDIAQRWAILKVLIANLGAAQVDRIASCSLDDQGSMHPLRMPAWMRYQIAPYKSLVDEACHASSTGERLYAASAIFFMWIFTLRLTTGPSQLAYIRLQASNKLNLVCKSWCQALKAMYGHVGDWPSDIFCYQKRTWKLPNLARGLQRMIEDAPHLARRPKHYMTKKGLGIWTRESMSVPLLMKPMTFREGPRTTLASTKTKCRRSSSDDNLWLKRRSASQIALELISPAT